MSKLLCSLQREQSLQEGNLAKWEAGEIKHKSKVIKMQDQRLQNLVSDYEIEHDFTVLFRVIGWINIFELNILVESR